MNKIVFKPIDLLYGLILGIFVYIIKISLPDMDIFSWIILALTFLVLIIGHYFNRYKKATGKYIQEFARNNNFHFETVKIDDITSEKRFDLFNTKYRKEITDYYTNGKESFYYYSRPIVLNQDYQNAGKSNMNVWFFVLDIKIEKNLPQIIIFSKKDLKDFNILPTVPHLTLESNQFNQRYVVHASNDQETISILDPLLMNLLNEEKDDYNIEFLGDRFLMNFCGKVDSAQRIEKMYQLGLKIVKRLDD